MRGRLIELLKGFRTPICEGLNAKLPDVKRLADHLLSEGVIVPPCRVGDKIYALTASLSRVHTYIVTRLEICDNGVKIFARQLNCHGEYWMCWADDFGNNDWVFLTQEEAEKALVERS